MLTLYGSMYEAQAKTLDSLSAALPESAKELITYLSEQIAESETGWSQEERARAYYFMGVSHYFIGQYRVSNVYYREALERYKGIGDKERQEAVWNNKGINFDLLEQHELALDAYEHSLALARELADEFGVAQTLLNVGLVNNKLSMYEEALSRTREAMAIFKQFDDAYHVSLAQLNKSLILHNMSDHARFELLIDEAIDGFRNVGNTPMLIRSLVNKAVFLIEQNRIQSAWPYLQEADELARADVPQLNTLVAYNIISYFMEISDYNRAYDKLRDLEEGLDLEQAPAELVERMMESYVLLYASMNSPEKIKEILERRRGFLRERNQARALEAMAEFEVIEDIVVLEATISAQQQNIAQQRIAIAIISGFLVVVAALLVGLLLVFRELRRQQKIRALATLFEAISPRRKSESLLESEHQAPSTLQRHPQSIHNGNSTAPPREAGAFSKQYNSDFVTSHGRVDIEDDDLSDGAVEHEQMQELFSRIHLLLTDKELYLDATLRQEDVSKALESNTSYISKAVNLNSGLNFNKFLNMYRIEHARKLMEHPEYTRASMQKIYEDSGFLNMATFYRNFKDLTRMTPALYRKLVKRRILAERRKSAAG